MICVESTETNERYTGSMVELNMDMPNTIYLTEITMVGRVLCFDSGNLRDLHEL